MISQNCVIDKIFKFIIYDVSAEKLIIGEKDYEIFIVCFWP